MKKSAGKKLMWFCDLWSSRRNRVWNYASTTLKIKIQFLHQTHTHYLFYIWLGIYFNAILSNHPNLFSHCVQTSILYLCGSFAALHIESFFDNLEGIGCGERWKRVSGWKEHMYTYDRFTLMHGKNPSQYCKVISLQLK